MSVLIYRADAGPKIGVGHVMRGLALVEQWIAWGGEAVFCGVCEAEGLQARVEQVGAHWLRAQPDVEVAAWVQSAMAVTQHESAVFQPWVVLDGYGFGTETQAQLAELPVSILILDDLAALPAYQAALVLNQNPGARRDRYPAHATPSRWLLGPRYALLRRTIVEARQPQHERQVAGRVLITMGGADPGNAALKILQSLDAVDATPLDVRILVGAANPHRETLESAAARCAVPVALRCSVADVVAEFRWADVIIAAPGVTALELCCLGIPALYVVTAENQGPGADALADAGVAVLLGSIEDLTCADIATAVTDALLHRAAYEARARHGTRWVDGRGAKRVVQAMRQQQLVVRGAVGGDSKRVFEWASDAATRQASFQSGEILWSAHETWFQAALDDPRHHVYMIESDLKVPVAFGRFQEWPDVPEGVISINLAPELRGMGLATPCIRSLCEICFRKTSSKRIKAYIKSGNGASLAAFKQAGFGDPVSVEMSGAEAICMTIDPRRLEHAA